MMQNFIRRIIIGCLAAGISACLLNGCANNRNMSQETGETTQLFALPFTVSPSGVLRVETETELLQFYDFTSEQKVYLCNKAGCTHDGTDCGAYMENLRYGFYYNDSLYLIQRGEMNEILFYRANRYGEERTEIAAVDASIISFSAKMVDGSLCFIGGYYDMDEKSTVTDFYMVDLNTGKVTDIATPDLGYSVSQINDYMVTEDSYYLICSYTDFSYGSWDEEVQEMTEPDMSDFSLHFVLYRMDRNSGECSTVLEMDSETDCYMSFLQEDEQDGTFLVQWNTQVLEINTQNDSTRIIFELEDTDQIMLIGDYQFLFKQPFGEMEEILLYKGWECIGTLPAQELQMCYGMVEQKVIFIRDMQVMYLDYNELEQSNPTIHEIDI